MADTQLREISGMFDGPVLRVTVRLGLPILLANFFNFLYNIVDTFFIAMIDRSSTAFISGTGIVFPVYFLFMAVGSGLAVGVSTLVGRAIGEKNTTALRRISSSGLLLAVSLSAVTLVLGYLFIDDIIRALAGTGMSPEAIGYGIDYFRWVLPGLIIQLLLQVFIGIIQGEGQTKYIAIGMTISTVANIALDPLFIFTFKMGVAGAALATSISIALVCIYAVYVFLARRSTVPLSVNIFAAQRRMAGQIIRIGFPQALGMLALSISFMLLNKIVSGIGEAQMNSWSLCGRMDQIVLIPIFAISAANTTMVAQNYGRQNLGRVSEINRKNNLASLLVIIGLAVLYIAAAPFAFRAFSSVDGVIRGSVLQVRVLALTFVGVSAAIICGGTFQGTGSPLPALAITLLRIGLVAVPLAWLFVSAFGWGMPGVFAAVGVGNLVSLPLSLVWAKVHLKNLRFQAVAR